LIFIAYLDVNRDDLSSVDEAAALQTELTLANVDSGDHNESCVIEALVNHDFNMATEDITSPFAKNDFSCSLSAEKVNKLKLMQHGSCRYNEVRSICTINEVTVEVDHYLYVNICIIETNY